MYFFDPHIHYFLSQTQVMMEHVRVCVRVWVCVLVLAPGLLGSRWDHLNMHPEHLPYILANDPHLAKECRASHTCPFKVSLRRCPRVAN